MKKPSLLFLSYYFPPAEAVAAVRAWNIAKHLVRKGWRVRVVTPHHSIWRTRRNSEQVTDQIDQSGIERILTAHRWQCLSPGHLRVSENEFTRVLGGLCRKIVLQTNLEREVGWIREAERACLGLSGEDVDLILATGGPFVSFELANRLSMRLRRPYVLDYRDHWDESHLVHWLGRRIYRTDQKTLIGKSALVTAVSEQLVDEALRTNTLFEVVTNGFDRDEMSEVKAYRFDHFALVYTGEFYPPTRTATPLMAALSILKGQVPTTKWIFHYYGGSDAHVVEEAKKFGVRGHVVLHGEVPRAEALAAVRGAGLAVVITSVSQNPTREEKGIVTGKLFEPIGLGTPVLLVAPEGSYAEKVIQASGLGRMFSAIETKAIADYIIEVMSGRKPSAKDTESYAWGTLIGRLDSALRLVISGGKPFYLPRACRQEITGRSPSELRSHADKGLS